MIWQRLRAQAWIPALAVAAMLLAKWQAAEKRTAIAERPQRIPPQHPLLEVASPRLFTLAESTRDELVRPVSELSLQPAISGWQATQDSSPSSSVIREPVDEPLQRPYPPAIVKREIVNRYASEGRTEVKVAPNSGPHIEPIAPVQQAEPQPEYFATAVPTETTPILAEPVLQLQPSKVQPTREPIPIVRRMVEHLPQGSEMEPVNQLARQHVQKGFSLGDRNALYAARVEFMQGLQTIGQAVDAHNGLAPDDESSCSQALGRAMQALEEAEDFAPAQGKLAADLNLKNLITSHRTPAGKTSPPITQMAALQCYFDYARGELISAAAHNPVASQALSGLGKCCVNDPQEAVRGLGSAKGMVFHQAAIATDSSNHLSANELGVLLGKYGQWSDAKRMFLQAARVREDASTWQNLAVAHQQLGEVDLARLAVTESRRLQAGPADQPSVGIDGSPTVQWVDPQAFGGPPEEHRGISAPRVANRPQPSAPTTQQKSATAASTPWWMPWR